MDFHFKGLVAFLALCQSVWAAKLSLRQQVAKGHHHHLHVRCFTNTSAELCDVLMSSVIKEKEREMEEDRKAGRQMRQLKVNRSKSATNKLPGDGAPPDWWQGDDEDPEVEPTRLSPDCEEPEDPPEDVGGWGPDKIYCCHTAQALVEDLETKKEHCDADPPVDCWKSLREVLPNYIAHFRQRRDWLCRTTTTTTITITTTTITTTTAEAFEGDLRLVPPGGLRGRLEIFHNYHWGTICEDRFEQADATVACRQLGLPGGQPVKNSFGEGTGDIWMDDVGCAGDEDKLMNCSHNGWGIQNCGHPKDVAIACEPPAPGAAPAPAPGIDWCLELCLHHTEAERVKCENLCREIYARTVHRDECAEVVETAGEKTTTFPAAPAPSGYEGK